MRCVAAVIAAAVLCAPSNAGGQPTASLGGESVRHSAQVERSSPRQRLTRPRSPPCSTVCLYLDTTILNGRVTFDDPDDLAALSVVTERRHGTGSLILHG